MLQVLKHWGFLDKVVLLRDPSGKRLLLGHGVVLLLLLALLVGGFVFSDYHAHEQYHGTKLLQSMGSQRARIQRIALQLTQLVDTPTNAELQRTLGEALQSLEVQQQTLHHLAAKLAEGSPDLEQTTQPLARFTQQAQNILAQPLGGQQAAISAIQQASSGELWQQFIGLEERLESQLRASHRHVHWQQRVFFIATLGVFLGVFLLLVCPTLKRVNRQLIHLRNSQNELQGTLDALGEGVLMVDARQRIRRVNRKAAKLWGRSVPEMLAASLHDLFPDGLGSRGEDDDESAEQTRFNALTIVRADGHQQSVKLRLSDALIDGERRLILALEDISRVELLQQARQRTESLLRLVIDALPLGVAYVDATQTYRYANQQYAAWFEWPLWQLPGQRTLEVLGEVLYRQAEPYIKATLEGKLQQWEYQVHAQGNMSYRAASYIPHRDADAKVLGYLVLLQDVTERKQQELVLQDALYRADDANRFIQRFLANVSHEIRTPLNAIMGFGRMLGAAHDPGQREHALRGMERSTQTLLQWFEDVLFIAQRETTDLAPRQETVDIHALVSEVLAGFQEEATSRGLHLCADIDALDRSLRLDGALLRQALVKLVANGLKFTQQGSVTVRGQLEAQQQTNTYSLCLAVEDTGSGIDPAQQEAIFSLFWQADDSSTRQHGGSGMGLSICQRLLSLLGGQLELDSELGVGSCFRMRIANLALGGPSSVPSTPVVSEAEADNRQVDAPAGVDTPRLESAIYQELLTRVASLQQQKRFSQIRQFAERLQVLGESEQIPALRDLGERLAGAVRLGRVGNIRRLLAALPDELQRYQPMESGD